MTFSNKNLLASHSLWSTKLSGNTYFLIPTDNRFCGKKQAMDATLEAFRYKRGVFLVLDQLLLPGKHEYVEVKTVEDGWSVINKMQVCIFSF